jgi:hypothetical protein
MEIDSKKLKMPLLILSGTVGAGKSTLLKWMQDHRDKLFNLDRSVHFLEEPNFDDIFRCKENVQERIYRTMYFHTQKAVAMYKQELVRCSKEPLIVVERTYMDCMPFDFNNNDHNRYKWKHNLFGCEFYDRKVPIKILLMQPHSMNESIERVKLRDGGKYKVNDLYLSTIYGRYYNENSDFMLMLKRATGEHGKDFEYERLDCQYTDFTLQNIKDHIICLLGDE